MSLRRLLLPYAAAGGLAALVDLIGFQLLSRTLPGVLWPAALSFLAAAVVNYLGSSWWVYRRDWRSAHRAMRFIVFAGVGLAINAGTTWALATTLSMPPVWAKAGGIAVAFGANFMMNTLWVFGVREARQSSP